MIAATPALVLPRAYMLDVLRGYARSSLFLQRLICGTKVEWRGRDKLPKGACIVACKHQSAWETFALFMLLEDPAYVLKRELMRIPLFGSLARKARMIPIDRGARGSALARMAALVREEAAQGRQIVIFPEGTRRPPGAEPRYLPGVAQLYAETGLPCVPIALNSGLFWPRRTLRRYPGTIVAEVLEPIPPGLGKRAFLERLRSVIEDATARLIEETANHDQESRGRIVGT